MGFIGTEAEYNSGIVGTGDVWGGFEGMFDNMWDVGDAGGDYQSGISGNLSYDKIHPPKPDMSGIQHTDLQASVLGAQDYQHSLKDLATYWAGQVGDDDYSEADAQTFANSSKYQSVFKPDTQGWRDDWGDDPSWEAGSSPSGDDWKTHRGKRDRNVDLPFMTEVESKFKSLETALGYNADPATTDLVEEVFTGYGEEIDPEKLQERGDDPSIVIGEKITDGEDEGELDDTGELPKTDDASGAWGQYLTSVAQIKETYTEDKADAKEDYQADLKSIKAQKKALGSDAAPGLRETIKKGAITGLRKGGRRAGGFGRTTTEGLQSKSKELGGLREKARSAYNNKLERLVLNKKQDIEGKSDALITKVETEFTELAGDIKVAEIKYQADSLELDDDRSGNIFDLFQSYEQGDPAYPWPRDPDRGEPEDDGDDD